MERCIGCRYYDRGKTRGAEQGVLRRGPCRRNAPVLSPINIKGSTIEGVWPTVRDDDWCGEWAAAERRPMRPAGEDAVGAGTATAGSESERQPLPPLRTSLPSIDALLGIAAPTSAPAPAPRPE